MNYSLVHSKSIFPTSTNTWISPCTQNWPSLSCWCGNRNHYRGTISPLMQDKTTILCDVVRWDRADYKTAGNQAEDSVAYNNGCPPPLPLYISQLPHCPCGFKEVRDSDFEGSLDFLEYGKWVFTLWSHWWKDMPKVVFWI